MGVMEWRIKPVDRSVCVCSTAMDISHGVGFSLLCVCVWVPSLVGPAVSRNPKENFFFFYRQREKRVYIIQDLVAL
jgi:hypothetical protein